MTPGRASLLVGGGATLFATAGLSKGLGPDVPDLVLACLRLLGAAAVLALVARGVPRHLLSSRPVLAAGLAQAVFQVGILTAFSRVGLALGTLVAIGLAPAVTGVLTRAWTPRWLLSTALALTGLVLLVGTSGEPDPLGLVAGVAAAAALSAYIIAIGRPDGREGSVPERLTVIFGVGGLLLVPLALVAGPGAWSSEPTAWLLIGFLALVPTVLAYLLYNAGSPYLGAPATATLGLMEPVAASVLGVLVLSESMSVAGVLGAVLVATGVVVLATGSGRALPTGETVPRD